VDNYDRDITIDQSYNENIEEDYKKKKVPDSVVEHKEIRKKIMNRENIIRDNKVRNQILEEFVYPLVAWGVVFSLLFLVVIGIFGRLATY